MDHKFHDSERTDLAEHVLRCEARWKAMLKVIENNTAEMKLLRRALYVMGGLALVLGGPEAITVARSLMGLG